MSKKTPQEEIEYLNMLLADSAKLVNKLKDQNTELLEAFSRAARGKEAADKMLEDMQGKMVRIYEDLASEVRQKNNYEHALKNIASIIETVDERAEAVYDVIDELSVLTVYGHAIFVEKTEEHKSNLDLARELIRDIQIEISDCRLNDTSKLDRINQWCHDYMSGKVSGKSV